MSHHWTGWCQHDWPIRSERGSGLSRWNSGVRGHSTTRLQLQLCPWQAPSSRWDRLCGVVGVRWDHVPGGEICRYGGVLFGWQSLQVAHLTSPFTTTCSFLDLPANAWSFIVETTKWKKTIKKEKRKKRNKCIIGHLSVCHIVFPFWQFTVCETVSHLLLPPCILSLSTQSCWRLLRKRGRMFLFKSCWIGSPLGAAWGFSGFCSSTLNSVGERERPFSVSSLFFFSGDVFVLSNFQFSWHNFSCWFREALSEEPGL